MTVTDLDQRLAAQIAHAYANAPGFRQIMDKAGVAPGDVQTVTDLQRVPVTSKDRLVEMQRENPPFGGWVAVPLSQLARIYLSPGPLYDAQGFEDDVATASRVALAALDLGPGDIAVNTFLYHMVPTALWLDEGLRAMGVTVMPFGPGNSDLLVMVMQALKPNVFVGTPSYLESVYSKAAQMGLPPEALPLRKAFFAAEPYLPAQRQKFEGEYQLRTTQAYGTADLGLIGYERPGKQGFYLSDNLIVECVDPETGQVKGDNEPGEVVVTTFSRAYPLIRLGTGDMAVMDHDEEGARRIRALIGRTGEAVKVRGMFLHPNQLRMLMGMFPAIKNIAAIITRPGESDVLTLQIELGEGETLEMPRFEEAFRAFGRMRADAVQIVPAGTLSGRMVRDERK